MKLSVVIPVYNEKSTLQDLLQRVRNVPVDKEIVLVDDYSIDGTRDLLKQLQQTEPDLKIIFHERNQGKGAALSTGFKNVAGDIVIIQDADLEYNPEEYPQLLAPILDGRADVVYGSRFLGSVQRVHLYWHYVGNKFFTLLSNVFTNINLTDMETCYKVFTREALAGVVIKEKRFGFEPEITAKMAKKKLRIYEVPISYYGRTYEQGKKIDWKDGVRAFWCILKYNLWR